MPSPMADPRPLSASAAFVRRELAERGITQREFAVASGLSADHLSRILTGKAPFPRRRSLLIKLAGALGRDPAVFAEFRTSTHGLPGPARRLGEAIAARGLDPTEVAAQIPHFGAAHLRAILRGAAFPSDPAAIAALARACGLSPLDFQQYLPLPELRDRLLEAAQQALDPADMGVFQHLLAKIEAHLTARWS